MAAASVIAGCGGGGGGVGPTVMTTSPPTLAPTGAPAPGASASQTATATFVITWPTTSSPSATARGIASRRGTSRISPSTASVTIAVNNGTPTIVNNPNLGSNTSMPTTTVTVPAPLGTDTFLVGTYDKTAGGGSLLDQGSVQYTIVETAANVVPITLNGNLASITCAGVAPLTTGTNPNLTQLGAGGQVTLTALDADKNVITSPGNIPPISFAAGNGSGAVTGSSGNTYTISISAANTPVPFTASGANLAGTLITSTCNVTRVPAMYVSNHGGSTVAIYPATASGTSTPAATISGSKTNLTSNQFVAADPNGNVFVTNQGPMPGATFGPNAGYVAIYGANTGLNGNIAPTAYIAGLGTPEGLAFDKNGNLYVMEIDRIEEYPPNANGIGGTASPTNVITGSKTNLFSCYGLALDAASNIYGSCSNILEYFPAGSTGNVASSGIEYYIQGVPGMSFNSRSWLGASVDAAGNIIAPASNNNLNMIDVYSASQVPTPPTISSPMPTSEVVGTGFSQPLGSFVDSAGNYYIANYGNSTIERFSSLTTLESGLATATLTQSGTGLTGPYGVFVR